MRRELFRASFAALAIGVVGAATGPWQREFADWTADDARLIMHKSPWAKEMPMPAGGRPGLIVMERGDIGAPPPSASLGNPSNTTTGTNMSTAGNPGSAGPADPSGTHSLPTTNTPSTMAHSSSAPVQQTGLVVIWASAKPIRLAVLRLRSGTSQPPDVDVQRANRPSPDYVIAVEGLPAPEAAADPAMLKDGASLVVKGKPAVGATRSMYRKIGASDVYFFHFPKSALPLAVGDKQVEFKMKLGRIEVRRRFDLGEMQFQGELSL